MTVWQEVSWDLARSAASKVVKRLGLENIPLKDSLGRTLGNDALALCDLPTYTTSSMDGWAVAGNGPWKIIGDVKAGAPYDKELSEGFALRIATGAVIPQGTFGVVRWEDATVEGDNVHGEASKGKDIRPAGEECRKGEILLEAGATITPSAIGLLAASGYDAITVVQRPRVRLLLLGDELLTDGLPKDGRVRDSLGPQLPGWLERLGAQVISINYVTDELPTVIETLKNSSNCDVIVTTGGTADGPRDHIHGALDSLKATFVVDRVRSRPGHPMLLATIPHRGNSIPLVGLPGNPQSAIVGMMTLCAPLIGSLLSRPEKELDEVITKDELAAPANFTRLILGNLINGEFAMGDHLGSAMLRGLASSTGFAVAEAGVTSVGGQVRWLPLP